MNHKFFILGLFAMGLASCGVDTTSSVASRSGTLASYLCGPGEDFYVSTVGPNINKYCKLCHANPAPTYEKAKALIVPTKPMESTLYLKTIGKDGHRVVWAEGSEKAESLRKWIEMETR